RLAEATGAAMASDTPADRWVAVLDAVLTSPIRRTVRPAGLPPDPPPELLHAARMAASRVPALVGLLGLERAPIPPPPGRPGTPAVRRGRRPGAGGRMRDRACVRSRRRVAPSRVRPARGQAVAGRGGRRLVPPATQAAAQHRARDDHDGRPDRRRAGARA